MIWRPLTVGERAGKQIRGPVEIARLELALPPETKTSTSARKLGGERQRGQEHARR